MLQLELVVSPRIHLAAQQNGVSPIRRLSVVNDTEHRLRGLRVSMEADPPFMVPWSHPIDRLAPESRQDLRVGLALAGPTLRSLLERTTGTLTVQVHDEDGDLLVEERQEVELLAPNEWWGSSGLPALLAAFVLPNDPSLAPVLREISDLMEQHTDSGALDGYQRKDRDRVARMASAVFHALQARDLRYLQPPASFERDGQKVRLADELLQTGMGSCLDLTVLCAALLERMGLHALLVVVDGHAFPGVWLEARGLATASTDDSTHLRKRQRLGELLVFEATCVTTRASFAEAREAAERHLGREQAEAFRFAVDVAQSRLEAIRPLSVVVDEAAQSERVARSQGQAAPAPRHASGDLDIGADIIERPAPPNPEELRLEPADKRLARWKAKLLDLTLRNRLLNLKEGRTTLALPVASLGELEDELASGNGFELAPKPARDVYADPRQEMASEAARRALLERQRADAQANRVLLTDLTPAELSKRLTELYRREQTALEENGAGTLYLALGALRWFESESSEIERVAPLLLVPVTLARGRGAHGEGFTLAASEEETRVNVTLLKKLEHDFGLAAPELHTPPPDDAGIDVDEVLRRFTRLVVHQERWEVDDSCYLAQLSFKKHLMWLDLEAKSEHLLANDVVGHLFHGEREAFALREPLIDEGRLDAAPREVLPVVSADPSQLQAVHAALAGSSFVLQGPPGTGKSQTITLMIANLLAAGKTVLFVSEKQAALNVVHQRLKAVGLGPACLEVHSSKSNKKQVMAQLARALEAGEEHRAAVVPWEAKARSLATERTQLNEIVARLARPTPFGAPVQEALCELIGRRDAPRVPPPPEVVEALSPSTYADWMRAAQALEQAVQASGPPAEHPLRQLRRLPDHTAQLQREAEAQLAAVSSAVERLRASLAPVATELGLALPIRQEAVAALVRLVGQMQKEGPLPRGVLDTPQEAVVVVTEEARGHLAKRAASWSEVDEVFSEGLLQLELLPLLASYRRWAESFFVLAWLMLWSARSTLRTVAVADLPPARRVRELLDEAVRVCDCDRALQRLSEQAAPLYGHHWRGPQTDVDVLGRLADRAQAMRTGMAQLVGELAPGDRAAATHQLLQWATTGQEGLAPTTPAGRAVTELLAAHDAFQQVWTRLSTTLTPRAPTPSWGDLDSLEAQLEMWVSGMPQLRDWCFALAAARSAEEAGQGALVAALFDGEVEVDQVVTAADRSVREAWWDRLVADEPLLRMFRGLDHEARVRRFVELDDEVARLGREEVARRVARGVPSRDAPGKEMGTLRHQLQLQRRHRPLRKLFSEIPTLLKALKPCVLMSPLSVAQYLDPALPGFDVVVFDEASQIPPWDAVGAIARGEQVIIVGDSKQLPPTSFFSGGGEDEIVDDDDLRDVESILEEAVSSGLKQLRLRWHYRSRHEQLIAFSNHHYYDSQLRTFPCADHDVADLGVQLEYLPHGVYGRGTSRNNPVEAAAVVAEIVELLRRPVGRRPSVGVVTFNTAQQRLIQDELDRATMQDHQLREALERDEPVFVKNLENVQGDERDVILFSIGYGPDRTGKITRSFGPLNKRGGERRLNVAITRARERVKVFTSLHPDQIELGTSAALGARHLKTYLDYAQRGYAAIDGAVHVDPDAQTESPFEDQVLEVLRREGYEVDPQVGVSGYRIDLGVRNPARPGSYAVGVECDGATYHSSRVARERDRLRQEVLEGLGWSLVRVWSTDWWVDRANAERRLLEGVAAAVAACEDQRAAREQAMVEAREAAARARPAIDPEQTSATLQRAREAVREPEEPSLPARASRWRRPDALAPLDIDVYDQRQRPRLGQAIATLVEQHGPIAADHAWTLLRSACGYGRLGARIREAFEAAVEAVPGERRPLLREGTLYPATIDPSTWTGFRVAGDARTASEVPVLEVANLMAWELERAGLVGVELEALVRAAASWFGIKTVGKSVRRRFRQAGQVLLAQGRAREQDGKWVGVGEG